MKKAGLLFSIIIFIFVSSRAQDSSFVINGHLEKIKSGTIFLNIYEEGKTVQDSAFINNGEFKLTGFVSSPCFASLTMPERDNDYFSFYIEPATIEINGRRDSLKLLNIKGSAINADDKLLKERMKTINKWELENSKKYEQAYKENNLQVMDSLDDIDHTILMAKRKVVTGFVKDYPRSMRGAMAIIENFGYYAEAADVQPVYDNLDEEIKNSPKGREIKSMIDTYAKVAVGKKAPDILQYTPDSVLLSLSSLKGKYVLIDFWASWCRPCRRENPNIVSAYGQFKDKGFTVFGVSYDTKKDNWLKAIKADSLAWNQVSDLRGWQNTTSSQYGIRAIPSNILINREGIIVAKNVFGEKLITELNQLIN